MVGVHPKSPQCCLVVNCWRWRKSLMMLEPLPLAMALTSSDCKLLRYFMYWRQAVAFSARNEYSWWLWSDRSRYETVYIENDSRRYCCRAWLDKCIKLFAQRCYVIDSSWRATALTQILSFCLQYWNEATFRWSNDFVSGGCALERSTGPSSVFSYHPTAAAFTVQRVDSSVYRRSDARRPNICSGCRRYHHIIRWNQIWSAA